MDTTRCGQHSNGRDYLSLGIGNVFVSTPEDESEWIGTIKDKPSDFVVREVSLDGIVADLTLTADTAPKPTLKRKADKITKKKNEPMMMISSGNGLGLQKWKLTETTDKAQDCIAKLEAMSNDAKNDAESTVNSLNIDSIDDKELRTKLHVALATAFPLLESQTIAGTTIQVTIDRRFDGLKPYLEYPDADISLLLRFLRRVVPDPSITLRLKKDLPRSDRRPVHRIIEEKSNRMLRTTTVNSAIEVSWSRQKDDRERYLCVLKKIGLEHSAAISKVAKRLHCGRNDVSVAGVKDMFAVTYQFCVVASKRRPPTIHFTDLDLCPLQPVSTQLNRGELRGNRFELIIRHLTCRNGGKLREEDVLQRISNTRRFVNFYGEQRVGEPGETSAVGIRAPDIGRAMLQRDYGKAIDLMMSGRKAIHGKIVEVEEFRRVWKESGGDVATTLAAGGLPTKERTVLNGLKRFNNDPLAALRCIPFHDRMMFINAYQSLVWNHAATERMRLFGLKVVVGDLVMDNSSSRQVNVIQPGQESSFEITQVVLPLPGWDVAYPENEVSRLYQRMLSGDSIEFLKDVEAESSAKGSYRRLIAETQHPVLCHKLQDTISDYHLAFELDSGSYATVFLREILRTHKAPALDSSTFSQDRER